MKYKDKNIIYVYSIMKIIDNSPEVFRRTIPHKYIIVDKPKQDEERKVWIKGNSNSQEWTLEQAIKEHEKYNKRGEICCKFNMKNTPFAVFDVDTDDVDIDDFCEDLNISENDTVWVKGNTKGYHLWVVFNEDDYKKPSEKNIVECMNNCKGEYLGDVVFERIDKQWNYKNSYPDLCPIISEISEEAFSTVYDMQTKEFNKEKKNIKVKNEKVYEPSDNETLEKICDLIDPSYIEDRKGFLHLMIAMKNSGLSREYAIEFSKRSPKFDETSEMYGIKSPEDFDNFWDYADPDFEGKPLTEATLHKRAKESNEEEYFKLVKKNKLPLNVLEKGAYCVSRVISEELKKYLVYCNDVWYTVNKESNLWNTIKKPSYIVVSIIHKYLNEGLSILYEQLQKIDPEDIDGRKALSSEISMYTSYYSRCDSSSYLSNMFNHLTNSLRDDAFANKLDNNAGFLAYTNGILNITTNEFKEGIEQSDFITRTIPYDYEKAKQEDIDFVEDVILKICNDDEEHKNYYLACLGYALLGKAHLQKAVYYLVGQGGDNGKTLILDSLAEIAPCYVAKIERKTFEKNYTKAHKHLKNVRGNRIIYVEELEKGKKQNAELIKEIGDGKTISNEIMFGTDEIINILCKLFILGNHTPSFDSDGGMANRIRQLLFKNNFGRDNKEEYIENGIHYYVPDETLADQLQGEYKHALLSLLIKWGNNFEKNGMLPIPQLFADEAQHTLMMNDGFASWFQDNCIKKVGGRCGKKALQEASGFTIRELNDELRRMGFEFDKTLRIQGTSTRGGWKGFEINSQEEEEE